MFNMEMIKNPFRRALIWRMSETVHPEITANISLLIPMHHIISHWLCTTRLQGYCPACSTYEIATRFWEVAICPIDMCLTVYEFSFILFDLCLFITILNFILNYVLIVTFGIFTYYIIWIMFIIYCFICNYWILYFVTCLEVFWSVMS